MPKIITKVVDGIWVQVRWWNIHVFSTKIEVTH